MSRRAIFFDRDGVLVEEIYYPQFDETEAPIRPEDVKLLHGAPQAARTLKEAGYLLIIVSNQGAYAKGKTDLRSLWLAHERFLDLMANEGVSFDGVFYSYSHPNGIQPFFSGASLERKPNPYNLFVAAAQLDVDLSKSWMIGDRDTDVQCGVAAGARTIRLAKQTVDGLAARADAVVDSIADVPRVILGAAVVGPDSDELCQRDQRR